MRTIELTKGKVANVSDEDYETLTKVKWYLSGRDGRYAQTWNGGTPLLMHRVVADRMGLEGPQVDHINGDTHDNTRENLRSATNQQNQMNRHVTKAGSGVRGVYPNTNGRWQARLMLNQRIVNLGTYDTVSEAAEARRKGEMIYFGEFAKERKR